MLNNLLLKIRRRESPFFDRLYHLGKSFRRFEVPPFKPVCQLLTWERTLRLTCWHTLTRVFYYTPIFKQQCVKVGKALYLIRGIPLVLGHLRILLGDNVTLFGVSTFSGAKVFDTPTLTVGSNTYLGYQLIIDVGCDVTIGNNVIIADRVSLRSYDGHPADPTKRHLPAPPESSKPIIIEDNVWIGQSSIILKGVIIGAGSVVGAGTIVTKNVPPYSLAVGNPVRCIPLGIANPTSSLSISLNWHEYNKVQSPMLSTAQKPNIFRKTALLLVLIVVLISTLVQFGAPLLENMLLVNTPLQHADTIVVMGGDRFEKLPVAADLLKKGMAPIILLTNDGVFAGWSTEKQRNLYQVEWAEEELVGLGVPRKKIVKLPFYGSSTMLDMLAAKKYLLNNGLEKIIVVTSDYHTRRTYWTFKHGLKNYPSDIFVFPVKSSGVGTKGIALEYVKLAYYVLKYGWLGLKPDLTEVTLKQK